MATISSPGIGSGLDVSSLVSQLMAVERKPMEQIQGRQQQVNSQLSALGKLTSALTALQDKAAALVRADPWNASTVASAQPAAVAAAASSSGRIAAGVYGVRVDQLATAQTLVTGPSWSSASDPVGSGTLTLEFGTWNAAQTQFTPGGSSASITIAPGSDSLADVRDAINAQGAGITASLVQDASGTRLMLRADQTGSSQGFRVTVDDDDNRDRDAAGLSRLAFDPSSNVEQMSQTRAAANALAVIDGVAVESSSNVLDGVFEGLSLTLQQVTTTPIDITVTRDRSVARTAITDFAKAYNDLVSLMREQTRVGAAGSANGVLKGDPAATSLLSGLRNLGAGSTAATSALQRLSQVGLEPQRDGSLRVNDSALDAAMAQFDSLQQFFARDAAGTASDGFATLFKAFAGDQLASTGSIAARQEALRNRLDGYQERLDRLEDRLARTEKRITAQYSRLDSSLSALKSLQTYVEQQISSWNARSE